MPTKVVVHGQLPVYINLRIEALIEGRSINFNAFDILGISVSCTTGLSSLTYCHFKNCPPPWLTLDWFLVYQIELLDSYN